MFIPSTATFGDLRSVIRDLGEGFHSLDRNEKVQVYRDYTQVNFFKSSRPVGNILFLDRDEIVMLACADSKGLILYDDMVWLPVNSPIDDICWQSCFGDHADIIGKMIADLLGRNRKATEPKASLTDKPSEVDQPPVTFADVCTRLTLSRVPKSICAKFDGLTAKTNGPRELTILIDGKPAITFLFYNEVVGEKQLMVAMLGYSHGILDPVGSMVIPAANDVTVYADYPQAFGKVFRLSRLKVIVDFLTEVVRS